MINICFFSSGAASWLAAKRVAKKFGTDNLYLVFADTGIEDKDNYRFLIDAADNVGGELIWLKDGRSPPYSGGWTNARYGGLDKSKTLYDRDNRKLIVI